MSEKNMVTASLNIPRKKMERIEKIVEDEGLTKTQLINSAIDLYLSKEDLTEISSSANPTEDYVTLMVRIPKKSASQVYQMPDTYTTLLKD